MGFSGKSVNKVNKKAPPKNAAGLKPLLKTD